MVSKHHSRPRDSRPFSSGRSYRSSRDPIIGVRVSDTNAETAIATVTVTANSWNIRPTIPLMSSNGINTATREIEIERIVNPISPPASSAACKGFLPISICLAMFSTMTIASSTTKPTAIDRPISDRLSRL